MLAEENRETYVKAKRRKLFRILRNIVVTAYREEGIELNALTQTGRDHDDCAF